MPRITFRDDKTLGSAPFVRVLRDGMPLGKILFVQATDLYRFYEGNEEKLGGPDVQDKDLERLKAAILSKYGAV